MSRVLNGGPNVRDEVRERVWEAVRDLNYRVNPQARSLAGGQSRTLALILASDLEAQPNSFYASALELGALRECLALGFQLMARPVPQDAPDRRHRVLEVMSDQRCQGLILTPPFADDAALIADIRREGGHVALISPGGETSDLADAVGIDDEVGGHDIARHLIHLGHRRFGFIGGIAGHLSAERRFDGLARALQEAGLSMEAVTVARGDFTFRSGIEQARRILDGTRPPTALICANDDMAAGALSAAHALGLDIPGRISITGFDDTPVSEIVWPPLTTVRQPLKEMGQAAVRALAGRITGATRDDPWRLSRLEHHVIPRDSTRTA